MKITDDQLLTIRYYIKYKIERQINGSIREFKIPNDFTLIRNKLIIMEIIHKKRVTDR